MSTPEGIIRRIDAYGNHWTEQDIRSLLGEAKVHIGMLLKSQAFWVDRCATAEAAWIPVGDRLPPQQRMVLLHSPHSQRAAVQYGFYGYTGRITSENDWYVHTVGGWEAARLTGDPVTHWMPLPDPPVPASENQPAGDKTQGGKA